MLGRKAYSSLSRGVHRLVKEIETMQIVIQSDSVIAVQRALRKHRQMTSSEEQGSCHQGRRFSSDLKDHELLGRQGRKPARVCAETLNEEEAGTGKD